MVLLRQTLNILLLLALAYILLLLALIRISTVPRFTLPNQSPKLQHVYLPSFLLVGRSIQASSMMDPGNMPVFSSSSTAGSLLTSSGSWNPTPVLPSNVYKLQASFNSSVAVNQIQFKAVAGDQAHGPTDFSAYTRINGTLLGAIQTGCNVTASSCLGTYTLALNMPFKGASMYIKIGKTSPFQIWLFSVTFAMC